MYPMTPEQIKKNEPMNINNLYEEVPVENDYDPIEYLPFGAIVTIDMYGNIIINSLLRPVTRESLDEWLREFGEKVVKKTMESHYRYVGGFTENPKVDMQAALTELITQTLGQ